MVGAMLFAALAVAGCGKDANTAADGDGKTAPSFQDAMVDYAACMRENGVDMPDPTFTDGGGAGGGGTFAIPLGAIDAGGGPGTAVTGGPDPTFKAAAEACQSIMDEVQQEMPKLSAEEEAKMRDGALKFAQCMREHGVDMPDPTFDAAGGSAVVIQGSSDARAPLDTDNFNEAASACSSEGFGGAFSVSSAEGSGPGFKVGSAGSGAK
jgi:hypothetical protein